MELGDAKVKAGPAAAIVRLGRGLLDFVYPPTCLDCGAPVATTASLCPGCFGKLRPITAPYCPVMGLPFEVSIGPDALSAEAIADPPPFDRARSAVLYTEVAQALVARMKYGDRPELAGFCARMMHGAGRDLWEGEPVLVPVPLHFWRQVSRRYNQSTELARALARLTGLKVDTGIVRRTRLTRQQVGLSKDARQRNVAGAFTPHRDAVARLKGRGVVLVDDVITTGSTVKAITRALKRAGVEKIDVISFARVVTGADLPI
ncbi:ComF family protein [Devosia sp. CN2-171]|uniref:ComF family protein n=1 Tax=Devosia sp. CN2-171 TaxID=3400909 RepID=UPI003BF8B58E